MPFPEIGGISSTYTPLQDIEIVKKHPVTDAASLKKRFPRRAGDPAFEAQFEATVFDAGETFRTGFPDYIPIKPGTQGEVLARGAKSDGKGGERILVNLVYWLTDSTGEK